jgi:imidazole glycerol-phosphate synthase subunit HisF
MNKRKIRIIPRLEIKNGLLVKGINLEGLRVLGDPLKFSENYYNYGADEIIYTDVVATLYGTNNLSKFVKRTSEKVFVPLTVGGGIRSIKDIEEMLKNGADKVSINSSAIDNLNFVYEASRIFGSSTIVSNIECVKIKNKYFISKSNGRDLVKVDPLIWAKKLEDSGVGEIVLVSVNHEGLKYGFDLKILDKISSKINIPVIAAGGAGEFQHIYDVIRKTNISGVSISSLFHYNICSQFKFKKKKIGNFHYLEELKRKKDDYPILKLKKFLKLKGIDVRS